MEGSKEYLTVSETARIMNVSKSTVRDLCRKGILEGATQNQKGQPWQIPVSSVEKWHKTSKAFFSRKRIISIDGGFLTIMTLLAALFGFLNDSGIRESVYTLFRGAPFESEQNGETLIIIANFYRTDGVADDNVHGEIKRAIEDSLDELGIENVRVEIEPTSIKASERDLAEKIGNEYKASMIIWGSVTRIRIEANFLNLKEPDFDASKVTLNETERTELVNPDAYAQFVIEDLPNQISFLALFTVGQTFYIRNEYAKAIPIIQEAVNLSQTLSQPSDELLIEGAYFRLAWMYQQTSQYQLAIANYNEVLSIAPQDKPALLNLGTIYGDLKRFNEAIDTLTQIINIDSEYAPAYNNRGIVFSNSGELEKAIADFNSVIAIAPQLALPYYNRGLTYEKMNEYQKALADYNQAIEIDPKDVDSFNNRGIVYEILGQQEEAISSYTQAIEIYPTHDIALFNRGMSYRLLGEFEKALADLDQALLISQEKSDYYFWRGTTYLDLMQYDAAIPDLDKAILLDPQQSIYFFNRATAFEKIGDLENALKDYDQSEILNPQDSKIFVNRGNIFMSLGKHEDAITDFDQAISINSEDYNAFYNRGLAHGYLGNYEAAVNDFSQAIELFPQFSSAIANRGYAYLRLEKFNEAIEDFQLYLELEPQSDRREEIEQIINDLYSLLNN